MRYLFILFLLACNKQTKQLHRNGGTQPDQPDKIASVVLIKSNASVSSKKDSDKDGIYDVYDLCPKVKENFNGYLDTDGCPDEMPPPPPPPNNTDTDGDGVIDLYDKCSNEKENYNGYLDDDGCFDVPVITLPPMDVPSAYALQTPVPGNQGNEGTCVPFACTYGARSIERYYQTSASYYDYNTNVFSPEYTFNVAFKYECATGTSVTQVLDIMINQGVCVYNLMPYDDGNGCTIQPNDEQKQNAALYKINGYAKVIKSDRAAIQQMIYTKHPAIFTVVADNSFINAGPGFVWRSNSGSGALPHTMILCGYDNNRNAYKILNSWGTSWGDNGYGWIDYDYFVTACNGSYVYVIQ